VMAYLGDKLVAVLSERGDGVKKTLVKRVGDVLDVVPRVQLLRQPQQRDCTTAQTRARAAA